MKRLKENDLIFAYMKGLGYVGFGRVVEPAIMAKDFAVEKGGGKGKKLLECPLLQPGMKANSGDPELSEWVVAVKWTKTFARDEAKTFTRAFANQHIVCQLRDPATVEFLKKEFEVF